MNNLLSFAKKSMPLTIKKLFRCIRDIYQWDSHFQKSWAQEGEDLILSRYFKNKTNGFYIDVGAHHPKRFSNTYLFYKKGWNGVNIDAMPNSMKLFKKIRPRDTNIEKPISDKKEVLTYFAFNDPALNGFSKELSDERERMTNYFIKFTRNIETITLEEILDQYLPKNQEIDFLSIDVEGLDFRVLQSNNFQKHRPKVILIEILGSSLKNIENNEISKYLKKHKYSAYAKTVNTVIYRCDNYIK